MLLVYCTLSGRNTHGGTRARSNATCHPWRYVHTRTSCYNLPYPHSLVTCTVSPSGSSRLPTPVDNHSPTPSLGVHLLLPYFLKHFGVACSDPSHPAFADLMYNVEREWAWALGNAFMNEVSIHGRVFVQPIEVLAYLGRVAWDLLSVPLHLLERSTRHVPWTYSFALGLMHQANEVGDRHLRYWSEFATGDQSSFLAYDRRGDAFVARSTGVGPSSGRPWGEGGVGSASREARKKRYWDLDNEPAAYQFARVNQSPGPTFGGSGLYPTACLAVPPVPPLNVIPPREALQVVSVRHGTLERDDIRAVPVVSDAVGQSADRSWQVDGLLSTLAS